MYVMRKDGKIPEEWSWLFEGNGDALTWGLYRGMLEHAMKDLERVIEGRARNIILCWNMQ